jgi:hypothetical protein
MCCPFVVIKATDAVLYPSMIENLDIFCLNHGMLAAGSGFYPITQIGPEQEHQYSPVISPGTLRYLYQFCIRIGLHLGSSKRRQLFNEQQLSWAARKSAMEYL